jgi:hypothetical protein
LTLATFQERIIGALSLDARTFEEVEADRNATGQAVGVVLLAAASEAIGIAGLRPSLLIPALIGAIVGWLAWALVTFLVGTKILPERQTRADMGEMLRVLGFAAAPGMFGILGIIPFLGVLLRFAIWIWWLMAMVVAVRQALDYTSTGRAVLVCVIGWIVKLLVYAILSPLFFGWAFLRRVF